MKKSLPRHWVVREISPDYGLDLHIETFAEVPGDPPCFDALGEHFFAQVKAVEKVATTSIVPCRGEKLSTRDLVLPVVDTDVDSMEVVSYSLDVEEIETVRRMGSAVPVLLFVVDVSTENTYYICLNDWISKVLPEFRPDWRNQRSVVVHLPVENVLGDSSGWMYLSLLAKRPKLYGAFAEFVKYEDDIRWALSSVEIAVDQHPDDVPDVLAELDEFKRLFALYYESIVELDVWPRQKGDPALGVMIALRMDLDRAMASIESIPNEWARPATGDEFFRLVGPLQLALAVLASMAMLAQSYGRMTRNWRLPTQIGAHMSK